MVERETGATGAEATEAVDTAEQVGLAREIGQEMTDLFVEYVKGDLGFDTLTFMTFEALESIHAVASGEYELEVYDDEDEDGGYDIEEATREQEELAQEPSRDAT